MNEPGAHAVADGAGDEVMPEAEAELLPAGAHATEPGSEEVPPGQLVQAIAPMKLTNVPAAQRSHDVMPVEDAYVPTRHSMHMA